MADRASDTSGECDVFISYSQDSPEHKGSVAGLAKALEAAGYIVAYDQQWPAGPEKDWANYMAAHCSRAKHVIIVLSESYGKGRGSAFELTTIRNAEAISPQPQHLSKVYFDLAYDDPEHRRKHGLAELGGSFYSLEKGFSSANHKWIALLERIQYSTKKAATGYVETEIHHGIILVGDIVGFSDIRKFYPHKQELVLRQKWNFLKQHEAILKCNCPLDSTLDGAVVVFDEQHYRGQQPMCELSLDFAADWIKFMRSGIVFDDEVIEVPFRIGLEVGRYSQFRLDGENGQGRPDHSNRVKKIIGVGPNDCDRLTRIGDAYNIIIGQRFYEEFSANSRRNLKDKIFPQPEEPALEVYPKPYHKQLVRVYPGIPRKADEHKAPMVLRQSMAATENIHDILKSICGDFYGLLKEVIQESGAITQSLVDSDQEAYADGVITPSQLSILQKLESKSSKIRVSIFARKPSDPEKALTCTTFRRVEGIKKGSKLHARLTKPGTEYPIVGGGQGIVGKAFHSEKPIILHDLPDWSTQQGKLEYIARMEEFGFAEQVVRDFARHPRILICFRCAFGTLPPDAVVCLDSMSALPEINSETFQELGDYLQNNYGPLIALLLRVRG